MTEPQAEVELQQQMETAVDAIRAAALELLQGGRVHPHVLVLAAARVAGELGAGATLAGGMPVEGVLGDLAEVVREAGQDHAEALRAVELPVAGSAWQPRLPRLPRRPCGYRRWQHPLRTGAGTRIVPWFRR